FWTWWDFIESFVRHPIAPCHRRGKHIPTVVCVIDISDITYRLRHHRNEDASALQTDILEKGRAASFDETREGEKRLLSYCLRRSLGCVRNSRPKNLSTYLHNLHRPAGASPLTSSQAILSEVPALMPAIRHS